MKTLYLDCSMGAAGDMLLAALLEVHDDPADFLRRFNALGLPGVSVEAEGAEKCGIRGTHVRVRVNGAEEGGGDAHHHGHDHHHHGHENHHDHEHHHEHHHHHVHTTVADVWGIIEKLNVSERVKEDACAVYTLLARAEGEAHGCEMEQIHFHEVGTLDAVADIVGVCMLMEELGAEKIAASPVHVGSGQVRCAHGVLPVPAPATAALLRGIPIYGGEIKGELCTPTGAALLRHFADAFGPMPAMQVEKWGYGMGTKDFPAANCLRAALGSSGSTGCEAVTEICCNLDDMTGEEIAFACEMLRSAGALDVWTTAITMKKGRSAVMLSCLCKAEQQEALAEQMLRHTTTLGVRLRSWERRTLSRSVREEDGVRRKSGEGYGVKKEKIEFEDLAALARREGISLFEARSRLKK